VVTQHTNWPDLWWPNIQIICWASAADQCRASNRKLWAKRKADNLSWALTWLRKLSSPMHLPWWSSHTMTCRAS